MARTIGGAKKDPDRELEELKARRVALAGKRHELDAVVRAAASVLEEAPGRRRAVFVAEARRAAPPETVAQIDADCRKAEAELAGARERIAALEQVEREIGEEEHAVIDGAEEHFTQKAIAASEAAAEAIASASQAAQAAALSWREAAGAWGVVRQSRRRRGLDGPPEVPVSDLGGAVNELSRSRGPFPGGSLQAWERFRAEEGGVSKRTAPRLSNREAVARFGGEAA